MQAISVQRPSHLTRGTNIAQLQRLAVLRPLPACLAVLGCLGSVVAAQQTASPAHIESLVRDAKLHAAAGESVQAEALLRTALEQDPTSVPANNALGTLLLERRHWGEAMERFETVLREHKSSTEAQEGEEKAAVALALHNKAIGSPEAALNTLQHASSLLPHDAVLLTDIGVQAQSMGRLKTAKASLEAALAASPNNPRATYALARVEMDLQDFPAAEQHFHAYLKQSPADATAHYGLGRVYQLQQRLDAATQEFHESIRLEPNQAESQYQLGQMALDANRDEEARADFQQVVQRVPSHGGALAGLGILLYRQRKYEEAARPLAEAVTTAPDYQPAHYYYGLTLRRLGRTTEAEHELHLATELAEKQQGKGAPIGPS